MTSPHESNEPTTRADLGSTGQFRTFMAGGEDAAPSAQPPSAPPARRPVDDADNDRDIVFSDPVTSGPRVNSEGSLRPNVDLPPAELGSTAQFQAFASGTPTERPADNAAPAAPPDAPSQPAGPTRPAEASRAAAPEGIVTPDLRPGGARTALITLAAVILVVAVVVLLFVLF